MKKAAGLLGISLLMAVWGVAETRSSISQWGITWTFDGEYECGQFVNGDWYVVGPVTVQSVSPAPDSGRHGSMINPVTGSQAYDDRVQAYDAGLSVSFPVSLQTDQSLVSSISLLEDDCNCSTSSGPGTYSLSGACIPYKTTRPMLKTAAVLTCVAAAPSVPTFRPGFCGDDKIYHAASAVRSDMLPGLTPPGVQPDMDYLLRGLERPWLSHIADWISRSLHPMYNMLDYHAKIFAFYAQASTACLTDEPKVDSLVTRFVQHGIDMYHMVLLGHGGSGTAKWPILFAGLMLDDEDIKNVFKDSTSQTPFREDWMSYYGSRGTSSLSSSIVTDDMCWTGYTVPSGGHAGEAVMWRQDVGDAEHEHMYPSEWDPIPPSGGGCKHESYRNINSVNWPGMGLGALFLDARELWNHDAYFDYIDRWMDEDMVPLYTVLDEACGGHSSSYRSAGSTFLSQMWMVYRDSVSGPTGINVPEKPPAAVAAQPEERGLLSMEGRTMAGRIRSGVYFYRYVRPDGSCLLRKVVIVR